MAEIGLDRARVVAVIGGLVAACVAQHVACALIPRSAALATRSIIPEKSGFRAEGRSVGAPDFSRPPESRTFASASSASSAR